jgi:hypothetical protein
MCFNMGQRYCLGRLHLLPLRYSIYPLQPKDNGLPCCFERSLHFGQVNRRSLQYDCRVGSNGPGYCCSTGLHPFGTPRIRAREVRGEFGEAPTEELVVVNAVCSKGDYSVILIIPDDIYCLTLLDH